jgi:hypothetical protein
MGLIKQTECFSSAEGRRITEEVGVAVPEISPLFEKKTIYVNKDKRILVQGILQAVIQSQGLLLEPGVNYIQKVKETTMDLVKFVEENSK